MRTSGRERVVLDRERLQHVFYERGSSFALTSVGELDPDEQLGGGDGRDRDVVVVGDRPVQAGPPAFGGDQDRRVEDQAFQSRSSVTRSDRTSARSAAHAASGR